MLDTIKRLNDDPGEEPQAATRKAKTKQRQTRDLQGIKKEFPYISDTIKKDTKPYSDISET